MHYLKLIAIFIVIAIVQTVVSRLLGIDELMAQGKFGASGIIIYDITMLICGAIIGSCVGKKNV
jgi:fructose-specific phosphotransferase system IIC component